jgi:hypothetical protein
MTAYRLRPDAVPAPRQLAAPRRTPPAGGEQVGPQHPVADHQAAGDAQPDLRACVKSASTAGAKWAPKTSAVVVPAAAAATNSARPARA